MSSTNIYVIINYALFSLLVHSIMLFDEAVRTPIDKK